MSNLFLTEPEKENIKKWKYSVEDRSITTLLLTPFWNYALTWIPNHVAPNILTLAGFLCLIQSAYLTYYKLESYPILVTIANIILLFSYQTLDALDGKQARVTKNSSPIGELFDHTCDNIGVIFIIMTMCWTFGLHDPETQWYLVNGVQLLFMWSHLVALKYGTIEFGRLTGPGEVLLGCLILLSLRLYGITIHLPIWINSALLWTYLLIIAIIAIYAYQMPYSTRNGIWLCLGFRTLAAFIAYDLHTQSVTSMINLDVFCDGLFWCLITGDLIISKMAKRDLHPTIVIFAMASLINNNWLVFLMAVIYYLSTFSSLLNYLNLPMFTMVRTVYVNGVYDVAHYNHMKSFEKALEISGCNRLIVGVMSDQDTKDHKGEERPYDPLKDRVQFVKGCRTVTEVIPNAPWDDVPECLINQYGIDVVCHSEEYDPDLNDYAYRTPYELGIVKLIPRGDGISTSERVQRIRNKNLQQ